MREAQHQMREMGPGRDPREIAGRDPRELAAREFAAREQQRERDLREMQAREQQQREQQQQHPVPVGSILQRQLRPGPQQHDNIYDRGPPPDQRYR